MKKLKERLKQGSVLAIVLVSMTALIGAASAVFYSVCSMSDQIHTDYTNSQTYLSALSVTNMVADALKFKEDLGSGSEYRDLKEAAEALTYGKSITLQPKAAEIDGITDTFSVKVVDDTPTTVKDRRIYNLITDVQYNGSNETMEKTVEVYKEVPQGGEYFSTFIATTGLKGDTAFIDANELASDLNIFNKYLVFGGDQENVFYSNIFASGSANFKNIHVDIPASVTPYNYNGIIDEILNWIFKDRTYRKNSMKWHIAKDMWISEEEASSISLGGATSEERGTLIVGRDLIMQEPAFETRNINTDIYCLRDFYLLVDRTFDLYGDVYINGQMKFKYEDSIPSELEVDNDNLSKTGSATTTIHGDLYVTQAAFDSYQATHILPFLTNATRNYYKLASGFQVKVWDSANIDGKKGDLVTSTTPITHKNLEIKNSDVSNEVNIFFQGKDGGNIKKLEGSCDLSLTLIDGGADSGSLAWKIKWFWKHYMANHGKPFWQVGYDRNCPYCQDVDEKFPVNGKECRLDIDTSKGVWNATDGFATTYIRLQPNCYRDDDTWKDDPNKNDTFRWKGTIDDDTTTMFVCITGPGAVVFEMAPLSNGRGITKYQSSQKEYIGPAYFHPYYSFNLGNFLNKKNQPYAYNNFGTYIHEYYSPRYCEYCRSNSVHSFNECPERNKFFPEYRSLTYKNTLNNKIFLLSRGYGDDTINLDSNASTFFGNIYAPAANIKCGATDANTALVGSAVASSIEIENNRMYQFVRIEDEVVTKVFGHLRATTIS